MKSLKKLLFLGLSFSVFLLSSAQAQRVPTMEFFHGAECPHCHDEKEWFSDLRELYPDIRIQEYEVWHDPANREIWTRRMSEFGMQPSGVPTNIVGDQVIVGFQPGAIVAALEKHFGPPVGGPSIKIETVTDEDDSWWERYLDSPWPVMSFVLGLIDGFNPCAMWSLFVLIGFLLGMESKRARWLIGSVFVGSSALIYFAALLAYLLGFSAITAFVAGEVMGWIFRVVGAVAVITGLVIVKSAKDVGIDCEVRDADSKRKFHAKLSEIMSREHLWLILPGVVGLAFSVNAIELLCSFAIPTAFTATLVSLDMGWAQNITALLLYDIAYIFDDVLVLVIALWTMSLKVFSPKITQISHFLGGVLLLVLGLALLVDPEALTRVLS